jgi:hypothetical protein
VREEEAAMGKKKIRRKKKNSLGTGLTFPFLRPFLRL